MGKPTGFLEYPRETGPERPPRQRLQDFNEFHLPLSPPPRPAGRPLHGLRRAFLPGRAAHGRYDHRLPAA